MNKIARILPWLFGVFAMGSAAWYFSRPEPVLVQLVRVEQGKVDASINNTRAGSVKACRRAKLATPVGGQIEQLLVKKGQRVQTGDALLVLWRDDLTAQARLAEQQLRTATARAEEVCSTVELAHKQLLRTKQLHQQGFVPSETLDRAETEFKSKQSSCQTVQTEITQNRTRIDAAQAGLRRTVLKAPFGGIVADISGELGEYTTPSPPGVPTPAAIDLIDDSCVYVSAPIDEADAAKVKVGQPVRITLDAVKNQSFSGQVRRIAPYVLELEKQARTVEVEVAFNELPKQDNLLIGYSADVEIIYEKRDKVLRIPSQVIIEGKRVLVYRDGKLESREVKTGLSNWEQTEVLNGLQAGDLVVSSLDRAGVKAGVEARPETQP